MLKWLLWQRLFRRRRILLLSVAAVAMSVALLTVVTSLFTGFMLAYEQGAADLIGDFLLMTYDPVSGDPATFPRYAELIRGLEAVPAVAAASATLRTQGLVHVVGKGNVRAVEVWGIDPNSLARVTNLKTSLIRQKAFAGAPNFDVPGQPDAVGGFVGIGVIAEPNDRTDQYDVNALLGQIGRRLVLTTGSARTDDGSDPQARIRRNTLVLSMADVVFTGIHPFDHGSVYVPLDRLYRELHPDQADVRVDRIQIKTRPGVPTEQARSQITAAWRAFARSVGLRPGFVTSVDVLTAKELQARYLAEVRKQLAVLQLIFGVVDFGAVVLVFCIFYMIVSLKKKDIAILKSCGCSSWSVAGLFLGFGAVVGATGGLLGVVLGLVFTENINAVEGWIGWAFGLRLWDSSVYMFEQIPHWMNWPAAWTFACLAMGAACLGALVPAVVAARTRPVEILRYE